MSRPLVLFQAPGTWRQFTRSRSCYPPLGLCQLAAQAPDDTIIVDADAEELSNEEAFARVMALEPAMIGMTVTVATLELLALWSERFARAGVRTIARAAGDPATSRSTSTMSSRQRSGPRRRRAGDLRARRSPASYQRAGPAPRCRAAKQRATWGNRPSAQSTTPWGNRPSAQSTTTWGNRPSAQSTTTWGNRPSA
jgi:hypothetical protein